MQFISNQKHKKEIKKVLINSLQQSRFSKLSTQLLIKINYRNLLHIKKKEKKSFIVLGLRS